MSPQKQSQNRQQQQEQQQQLIRNQNQIQNQPEPKQTRQTELTADQMNRSSRSPKSPTSLSTTKIILSSPTKTTTTTTTLTIETTISPNEQHPNETQKHASPQIRVNVTNLSPISDVKTITATTAAPKSPTNSPPPTIFPATNPNKPTYYQRIQRLDSDVFIACDRLTKTNYYAIKLFQLEKIDELEFNLLTNDIKFCNQLKHPNILQYFYNFISKDQLWIIAPLCSFQSADRLSKPYGLPELAISYIIKDILLALDYLHKRGFIHRSIRASHILINSHGRCLLSGLKYSVNCIREGRWQSYIHEYPLMARPNLNWFAPELLEQNLFGYNYKSDIYSLGITCCELANGVVPFSDLQPTEMLLDKLTGNSPRLLDSTCQELINLKPNEMSPEDRDKYFVFRGRQFSSSFHSFTSGLCLNFDPQKRPDACKLSRHTFIKQLKKCPASNLLEFLDANSQVVQMTSEGLYKLRKNDSNVSGTSSVGDRSESISVTNDTTSSSSPN